MKTVQKYWILAAMAVAIVAGVLSLYQATAAAPQGVQQPFASSVEQRQEQINQLQEIAGLLKEQNALLREQNALLSSGKLQVVVTLPEKRP